MQISRIIIQKFQQFEFLDLDLSYPKDHPKKGKLPLEKVCFIGKNGTGKTTLIRAISNFLEGTANGRLEFANNYQYAIRIRIGEDEIYIVKDYRLSIELYRIDIDNETTWVQDFNNGLIVNYDKYKFTPEQQAELKLKIADKSRQLLIYSPSEVYQNILLGTGEIPATNLNSALPLFTNFPYYNEISFQQVNQFWNLIIYQVKQRENDLNAFLELEENQYKTQADVKKEFNQNNPMFLEELSEIWNRILDKAGLFFDTGAKVPLQLTDNLQAYIKLKSSKKNISYSLLSSGTRHYIFRLGYIASLYFNRKIEGATAIIDEPENSLFPDLLYDLVERYTMVTKKTQFFYATHSPIIASQFEPCERVILDFDESSKVITRKGTAALGDEPNDVLLQDFGIESLLGKEGVKKWERYVELKMLIKQEPNEDAKKTLTKEFLDIGRAYNF